LTNLSTLAIPDHLATPKRYQFDLSVIDWFGSEEFLSAQVIEEEKHFVGADQRF